MRTKIAAFAAFSLLAFSAADARVTRIVIDTKTSPAFNGASFGSVGQYETLAGRAWGELDPNHPNNAVITDIELAPKNASGKVEYMATFFIVKPIEMSRASGLMWHDVPNRGGRITISTDLREAGDVGLSSGWQGDNSGGTAHGAAGREYVVVPVAKNTDGSSIRGRVMGRIINASGVNSSPIIVHSNPIPYRPVNLNSAQDTLTEISSETITGVTGATRQIARGDWAWASCSATNPFPGTPDPTQICVKGGFAANKVHQVVFTAQDPYVLGIGFAAFRDLASFFKNDMQDSQQPAVANPVAGRINWVLARGSSQSGNFLRAFLHLGFNEDEAGRQVQDGNWPMIAGRRVSLNTRFAMPDGVLKLYEPGSEGPQWWHKFPDHRRGLPPAGILDRCHASGTCPKVIEHFGAAEIWGLKLGPEWVGTDAKNDIPLPKNVRRYYIPSTPHGGGGGGFSTAPGSAPSCPSNGYGVGTFGDNPMPHTQTVNAIRYHFRRWVMQDILPPDSVWPRKHQGNLVQPTKAAMGFPSIPGVPATAPTGLINPVLDYDFGPDWNYTDASGVTSIVPPIVKQVIPALVPKVDSDGNELGGVPVVLRDAPLGTYTGWNITNGGFHNGKICNYAGGWIPFKKTQAERVASGDPRPSLQERYGNKAGYLKAVEKAAARAVAAGFLLETDAAALITQANATTALDGL
jgi:Alpha/beta hydrolase domain